MQGVQTMSSQSVGRSVNIACILGRYYSMTLEATLQATGLDTDNFINPVDPAEDVVSATLPADDRAWAAQHVTAWRQCSASGTPTLIFQDDTAFSNATSDVLQVTKACAAAIDRLKAAGSEHIRSGELMYLGGSDTSHGNACVDVQGFTLSTVRTASRLSAYVLWPAAAAKLLAVLPLDMPVAAFLSTHIEQALAITPALAIAEEEYQAAAVTR